MKNITETHISVFFKEIERLENEREYFIKLGVLPEDKSGTNLIEFMTISDYTTKKIFLKQNNVDITKFRNKISKILNQVSSIWGMVPTAEDLIDNPLVFLAPEDFKLLVTYIHIADIKSEKFYSDKLHMIEAHNFNWEDDVNSLEAQLIHEDSLFETIIFINNLTGDYQEFENEIKLAIKLDPELNSKLNQLENILKADGDIDASQN